MGHNATCDRCGAVVDNSSVWYDVGPYDVLCDDCYGELCLLGEE